ncbi:MAG: hypothetical protein H0X18_19220 [Geodermatophilaceae bacterium]|nr:hypothetical protein [Geodermatophilaceae bacterium]
MLRPGSRCLRLGTAAPNRWFAVLCDGLVRAGHDVTLFAAPGSRSSATVHPVLAECHPDEIGRALYEADHVARVFQALDEAGAGRRPFDVGTGWGVDR